MTDCEIPVVARLVWEHDGAEHLDTIATAYSSDRVLVEVLDPVRHAIHGVWLDPSDVRRR